MLGLSFNLYVIFCILATFILAAIFVPQPQTESKCNRISLNNIYFLKVLLTYGIVLHHIFIYLGIWNRADICVEFFFIISGFMLLYTCERLLTFKRFISKKIIRFVPYIFFANLLSLYGKGTIDLIRFLAGIFLFSTTTLYPYHTYYMPSWYLVILFWISISYFIIIHTFRYYTYIIGIISLIALIALFFQSSPIEAFNPILPCFTNCIVRGFAYMGIGYFIATIFIKIKTYKIKKRIALTVLELFLLTHIPLSIFCSSFATNTAVSVIEFIVLMLLFLFQCGYISQILECSIWKYLALFTLPIFMTHDVIVPVMIYGSNFLKDFSDFAQVFILLGLSTLFGIITYYLFFGAQLCHRYIFRIFY